MHLKKITSRLTDGSEVFDVQVFDREERITLHAISEHDADRLIDLLMAAISAHAIDDAEVREG